MFVKSEVLSWYRIQEMFRFQSAHMYFVIASALVVATLSVQLLQRLRLRTLGGELIVIPSKAMTPAGTRYWMGGMLFGLGMGPPGGMSRSDLCPHRVGRNVDVCGAAQRFDRHVALRGVSVAASTLVGSAGSVLRSCENERNGRRSLAAGMMRGGAGSFRARRTLTTEDAS